MEVLIYDKTILGLAGNVFSSAVINDIVASASGNELCFGIAFKRTCAEISSSSERVVKVIEEGRTAFNKSILSFSIVKALGEVMRLKSSDAEVMIVSTPPDQKISEIRLSVPAAPTRINRIDIPEEPEWTVRVNAQKFSSALMTPNAELLIRKGGVSVKRGGRYAAIGKAKKNIDGKASFGFPIRRFVHYFSVFDPDQDCTVSKYQSGALFEIEARGIRGRIFEAI